MLRNTYVACLVLMYVLWTVILSLNTARLFGPLTAYYEFENLFCVSELTPRLSK